MSILDFPIGFLSLKCRNQEWTFQREKTDGEMKNGHFRERKPMGKSRIDISEKENRWGNQEWTFS
jgi:hypothetical protein